MTGFWTLALTLAVTPAIASSSSQEDISSDMCSLVQHGLQTTPMGSAKKLVEEAREKPVEKPVEARDDKEGGALLEADESVHHQKQFPATFFGDYSQGESTYAYNDDVTLPQRENPELDLLTGTNPQQVDPFQHQHEVQPAKWFTESASGGPRAAFQTYYPELPKLAGNRKDTGQFYEDKGGTLRQERLLAEERGAAELPASWFDSHVKQLDALGRYPLPEPGSPRNYLDWEERSVNTSLVCKEPGCTALATLQAPLNWDEEIYKNCRLSVFFHPTDFDDQYSGEVVEWVTLNEKTVTAKCHPMAGGCNKTAQRPLLPCVNDFSIDHLVAENNGSLKLSAKINDVVDECPYDGNMLSSVPTVTCLVSKKPNITMPKPLKAHWQNRSCYVEMPLQCETRGCAAEVSLQMKGNCINLDQCTLSVNVSQTDFDNDAGTKELIEYIKVDGKEIKKGLNPGENPCKAEWQGGQDGTNGTDGAALVQRASYTYSVLKDHKVTLDKDRRIIVEGKISQYVDECASNGYLLDGMAQITCKDADPFGLLEIDKKEDAQSHKKQLRGFGA